MKVNDWIWVLDDYLIHTICSLLDFIFTWVLAYWECDYYFCLSNTNVILFSYRNMNLLARPEAPEKIVERLRQDKESSLENIA